MQSREEFLEQYQYTDIECQFYMGSTAYRNQIYSAAAHWKYALSAPYKHEFYEDYRAMAKNALMFLIYNGLGVQQNRKKAVKEWQLLVQEELLETRLHLGFTFSDEHFSGRDPVIALGWYESIFMLHPSTEYLDYDEINTYEEAKNSAEKLKFKLSKKQIEQAFQFVGITI